MAKKRKRIPYKPKQEIEKAPGLTHGIIREIKEVSGPASVPPSSWYASKAKKMRVKMLEGQSTLPLFFNSSEFSPEEISEIIGGLSDVYQEISGDPLVIRSIKTYNLIQIEEPVYS